MNSPRLVLGPPVRDGKPYAVIAHTAQSVAAFVAIDRALAKGGVSVPEIFAQDLDRGFLLISHLGSENFLDAEGQTGRRALCRGGGTAGGDPREEWDARLEAAPGIYHGVPPFDRDAMMIEVELLVDWYVPYATGRPAGEALRSGFRAAWNAVFDRLERAEKSLVLRDFHSPNIIWRADRKGTTGWASSISRTR